MDSRLVHELHLRLGHPPLMPQTVTLVLEYCTVRGASNCTQLLDMGCEAAEYWTTVFRHFDTHGHGYFSSDDLQGALLACGYPVRGDFLTCLRAIYSPNGRVSLDAFVKVCAVIGSVCK